MNNAVFGKTIENVRQHRDITLVAAESRRNYSLTKPNYLTTKFFMENLLTIKLKKKQVHMNKPVYWGLPILDLSTILIYEIWYDYAKPKYGEKEKLYYMDTDSFFLYIETDNIYKGMHCLKKK